MMKQLTMLLMALLLACDCVPEAGKQATTTVDDAANAQHATTALADRVQEIYHTVFRSYNYDDSLRNLDMPTGDDLHVARDAFNLNYCSREWNGLMVKINEIDSMYHRDELGFWEADYWIMGQDWHELSVSDVNVRSLKGDSATVTLSLHNLGNMIHVTLQMVHEAGEWRIDNFIDNDNDCDWKRLMQDYVKTEMAKNN